MHSSKPTSVLLDLDGAWEPGVLGLPTVDLRAWGPRVRYCAPSAEIEAFYAACDALLDPTAAFVLYGSGDFHHLAGLWVRRAAARLTGADGRLTVVSFDNHPDWDVRPPRWGCGGWINRALEVPGVERASVWGCGNFELAWPARLFANRAALRSGRLEVHAWAERQTPSVRRRFGCMGREDWRDRFETFTDGLAGEAVYVTVDLDCLRAEEAATNWENGLFTADDVARALARLRAKARVVAGDLCGAVSQPAYARRRQRFAGRWDHPKIVPVPPEEARRRNRISLERIWGALVGDV